MRAVISPCGTYRYRLERETTVPGAENTAAAIIMVNPSTADNQNNDATIRKCLGFAERHGFGRIIVGNLFAYRSTDIKALRIALDPIGPENDDHLMQILRDAQIHIVAWGAMGKLPETLRKRWQFVVRAADRLGVQLHCIGLNDDGHPKHPLTTGYEIPLTTWSAPWFPNRHKAG
jgi:hypothetical protein